MARVTIEDCLENVDNRFELVRKASERATQLANGAEPKVARGNDKPTVIALREIAAGYVIGKSVEERSSEVTVEEFTTAQVDENKE